MFANTLGLLIILFGVLVLGALARPSWKRPDADSPESHQVPDQLSRFTGGVWGAKLGVLPPTTALGWGGKGG